MNCPLCKRKAFIVKQKDGDLVMWDACPHLIGVHVPTLEPVFRQPKPKKKRTCVFDNESGLTSCTTE